MGFAVIFLALVQVAIQVAMVLIQPQALAQELDHSSASKIAPSPLSSHSSHQENSDLLLMGLSYHLSWGECSGSYPRGSDDGAQRGDHMTRLSIADQYLGCAWERGGLTDDFFEPQCASAYQCDPNKSPYFTRYTQSFWLNDVEACGVVMADYLSRVRAIEPSREEKLCTLHDGADPVSVLCPRAYESHHNTQLSVDHPQEDLPPSLCTVQGRSHYEDLKARLARRGLAVDVNIPPGATRGPLMDVLSDLLNLDDLNNHDSFLDEFGPSSHRLGRELENTHHSIRQKEEQRRHFDDD